MKGRILSNFTVRKIQKVVVGTWREIFPGAFEQGFLDFPFIREFTRGLRKYCCISFGNKSWSYAFCSVAEPELEPVPVEQKLFCDTGAGTGAVISYFVSGSTAFGAEIIVLINILL